MNDFGAALIFFVTFLVVAYLRSGSVATIALALTALAFAAMIVIVYFGNHVQERFSAWGHVWEDPYDGGYQQTRSMIRMAVGGFFGLGVGQGWLKAVAASDTDLVFAFISEEWGLIMAVIMVLAVLVPSVFVLRSARVGRSSFYTIGACAAVTIMLTQTMLNVFGTMDLLPLTGVTLPFVSNGGSSMLCCWGLIAFIKGADTRQNASIAVKTLRVKEDKDE
jgi:cell division protein FtsW (lipid II flippase)